MVCRIGRFTLYKAKKNSFQGLKDPSLFASAVFLDTYKNLFKFLENQSQYDKIMDMAYSKTHIGGGYHRSFDGSHTLAGSYKAIKDRTGSVDFFEYIKSHFNELVTPEGIPLFTLNKPGYERLSYEISETLGGIITPGQIRECMRDMNSINAGEFLASGINILFLVSAIRSGDPKAISRVTASTLCLGFATANPLQVILGVCGLGYGIYHGKIQSYDLLRGTASPLAGIAGYHVARNLFNISKGGSIVFGIGATITVEMLLNHLEEKKKKTISKELGKKNPHYIEAIRPDTLQREFIKLSLHSNRLSLPI